MLRSNYKKSLDPKNKVDANFLYCLKVLLPFTYSGYKNKIILFFTFILSIVNSMLIYYVPRISGNILSNLKKIPVEKLVALVALVYVFHFLRSFILDLKKTIFYIIINKTITKFKINLATKFKCNVNAVTNKRSSMNAISASIRGTNALREFMRILFTQMIPCLLDLITLSISICKLVNFGFCYFIVTFFIFVYFFRILSKQVVLLRKEAWSLTDKTQEVQLESFQNLEFSKLSYDKHFERINLAFQKEKISWWKVEKKNFKMNTILDFVFYLLSCFFICYHCFVLYKDNSTLTTKIFVCLLSTVSVFHKHLNLFQSYLKSIFMYGWADLFEAMKILQDSSLNVDNVDFVINKEIMNSELIVVNNVSFCFSHSSFCFTNICVDIKKGEKIFISGPSGSGKSTLCKLLAGIYSPTSGSIVVFGNDTKVLWKEPFVNTKIKFISQDALLITGTVRENLYVYGPPAELFITYFKDRLDEQVGGFGKNLSNGERQMILFARNLATPSDFIIIDEALNALDQQMGKKILELIIKTVSTIALISHHKYLLPFFDREICCFNGGIRISRI